MKTIWMCLLISGLCLAASALALETQSRQLTCRWQADPGGEGNPAGRHYAPDRELSVKHIVIDVTPDFPRRTVDGMTTLRCQTAGRAIQEVLFDAVDLRVSKVEASRPLRAWRATETHLVLTFEEPVPPGTEFSVTASYWAQPSEGLYFRTAAMGYPAGDDHLFTQGETEEGRHWYPCLDAPNQLVTSEVICRVPEGMVAISNGRLVSRQKVPGAGLVSFHWKQEQPHANYLISLVAGFLGKLEDRHGDLPLGFYAPLSQIGYAATTFGNTRSMMEFFEKEIGVAYPWARYDQVCVSDFVAGGMENTSVTTLNDRTLFVAATENIHNSDGLVAHELVHQWFGDLATCKDWSHLWLNEGFATYYEALYQGHRHGPDEVRHEMYERAREIASRKDDTTPIVRRNFENPGSQFSYLAYGKGSWVLHMLRAELGEDLYRKCVRTFLERHRHCSVVTEDFRKVIEEMSHRNFDRFFDQWLYHGGTPALQVRYTWDETNRLAKLSVAQTHTVNEKVLLFEMSLPVRFKGKFGTEDRSLHLTQRRQEFVFPLPSAPESVRIDPEVTVLCDLDWSAPAGMWEVQWRDGADAMGRSLALEKLAAKGGPPAVELFRQALQGDPWPVIRLAGARGLGRLRTPEALAALVAALDQPDARVRLQVVREIAGYYHPDALKATLGLLDQEKNPAIIAAALGSLGGYSDPEIRPRLLRGLMEPSFENEIAAGAIRAIERQYDPSYAAALRGVLTTNASAFTGRGLGDGLVALARITRETAEKDAVYPLLLEHAQGLRRSVRLSAIQACGILGDQRAVAVLEKFADNTRDTAEKQAANRALEQLSSGRKTVEDLERLRREMLEIQKQMRELNRQPADSTPKPAGSTSPAGPTPAKAKPILPKPLASPKDRG